MFDLKKIEYKAHRQQGAKKQLFFSLLVFLSVFFVLSVSSVLRLSVTSAEAPSPTKPLYANDFEKLPDGNPPEDMVPLSGNFTVKTVDGNKLLELPGDPVEGYGILFGPDNESLLSVSARIYGTATGKRTPEFGVGLADSNGYKLWLMPATNQLQLIKGEDVKATAPFPWKSGSWTSLRLQVRKIAEGKYSVEGKAWEYGKEEPKSWIVSFTETEELPKGRPSVWGSPYSSTPIRFDDLLVTRPTE